jgi:hypothetical protein
MKIIRDNIALDELKTLAKSMFGTLVKAVVDIEEEIMVVGGDLHSDEEAMLLEDGSKQENLWGINIYPDMTEDTRVEFDSMINLRPAFKNLSRGVDDPKIQERIIKIVNKLIK